MMTLNVSVPAMRFVLDALVPLHMHWHSWPSSLQYEFSQSCLYLGCQRIWRYSMVQPVSGSKTGMARWSSDVSCAHHSASNACGDFRWVACAGVNVRACFSCDRVRLAMGWSEVLH